MTSVSKKINKLVSNPENDLTAELEIPELNPEDHETDDPMPSPSPPRVPTALI
jgi:hypothetical protein